MSFENAPVPAARVTTTTTTRFCSLEAEDFPAHEFVVDPHWGLVHQTPDPHTTMGSFIQAPDTSVPVADPPPEDPS